MKHVTVNIIMVDDTSKKSNPQNWRLVFRHVWLGFPTSTPADICAQSNPKYTSLGMGFVLMRNVLKLRAPSNVKCALCTAAPDQLSWAKVHRSKRKGELEFGSFTHIHK